MDSTQLETIAILIGGERDAQVREAKIVAIDREHDLALLRITGPALPALAVGDSDRVREGESVAFTGFPIGGVMGYTPVTVQAGPFSVFQLDATAYPGNSGSPVYDVARGEVVGIVNMVFVKGTREAALSNPYQRSISTRCCGRRAARRRSRALSCPAVVSPKGEGHAAPRSFLHRTEPAGAPDSRQVHK